MGYVERRKERAREMPPKLKQALGQRVVLKTPISLGKTNVTNSVYLEFEGVLLRDSDNNLFSVHDIGGITLSFSPEAVESFDQDQETATIQLDTL